MTALNRRALLKFGVYGSATAVGLAALSGCGEEEAAAPAAEAPKAEAPKAEKPAATAPEPAPSKERVEIIQWFNLSGAQAEHATAMGDAFSESQNDILVTTTIVPQTEVMAKLSTALAAGSPPEVLHIGSAPANAQLARSGDTISIEDFDPDIAKLDWVPGVQKAVTHEGRMMAYPANSGCLCVLYNKDLYAEAGLDPDAFPATNEDLLVAAETISNLGDDIYGHYVGTAPKNWSGNHIFISYIWGYGGDVISADGKKFTLTTPEVQAALQFYLDLRDVNAYPIKAIDNLAMGNDFETGTLGSMTLYPVWTKRAEATNHQSGSARMPFGPATTEDNFRVPVGFGGAHIFKESNNPEEGWPYLRWLLDVENHLDWVMGFGNLPAVLSYRDHPRWQQHESDHPLITPYVDSQKVSDVQYPGPAQAQLWNSVAKAIEAAVFDAKTVEEALADAEETAQGALDDELAKM
jgi:multiple sugar transport system substrate-binding protein